MKKECKVCKFLYTWKYADSIEIQKSKEYENELSKIYAKAKYEGSFLKITGIALGFIYFLIRDYNQNLCWLSWSVGIVVVGLLAIEACRIFFLPRCIDNEINNRCPKEI